MLNLKTEDTFELARRGTVHTLRLPLGVIPTDIEPGNKVQLDGEVVTVRGVEKAAVASFSRESVHTVGLLV